MIWAGIIVFSVWALFVDLFFTPGDMPANLQGIWNKDCDHRGVITLPTLMCK